MPARDELIALRPHLESIAKTGAAPADEFLRRKIRAQGLSEIVWRRNDGAIIGHGDMCLVNRDWPDSEPIGERLTPAGLALIEKDSSNG